MRRTLLTLLATAVLASAAAAQADKNARVERLRKLKIERYFKSVQENPDLDAKVKQRILRMREGATLGGEQDVIHQALILAYKDYKRGVALFMAEREKDALGAFRELLDSEDKYLAAYAGYRYGLCYLHLERFEHAAVAFTSVLNEYGRRVGCDIDAAFYLAVALGQDLQKEKALVAAQRFLDDYPDAPSRYRMAMEQMLNELVQEWESPLYDLAGRMKKVAREMDAGETGKETQSAQAEIITRLNELIKKAEDREGNQGGQGNRGGQPRGNQAPSAPATQSKLSPGSSRVGDLRGKQRGKAGDQWGKMKDREREEVLQALKEKLPDRYRGLVEQYMKRLAEGKRVTEPDESPAGEE